MRISPLVALVLAAGPVAAQAPVLFISGPKGCAFFEGVGGDGAVFHALDDDHMILDYWMLESTTLSCQFASAVSLDPGAARPDTAKATCYRPDRPDADTTFTVTYGGGGATVTADIWDTPQQFVACPR